MNIAKEINYRSYVDVTGITNYNINLPKQLDNLYEVFGKPNKLTKLFISILISNYIKFVVRTIVPKDHSKTIEEYITEVCNTYNCESSIGKACCEALPLFKENLEPITTFLTEQIEKEGSTLNNKGYSLTVHIGPGDDLSSYWIVVYWKYCNLRDNTEVLEKTRKEVDVTMNYEMLKLELEERGYHYSGYNLVNIISKLLDVHYPKSEYDETEAMKDVNIGEYYYEITEVLIRHFSTVIEMLKDDGVELVLKISTDMFNVNLKIGETASLVYKS